MHNPDAPSLAEVVGDIHDESYQRYARLVQAYIGAPVALVSFVDDHGQVFPGAIGLPEPWATARSTPLSHSFCQHVVAADGPLVVSDAREVDFLRDNLAIEDLGAIAYAGFPVRDPSGRAVGSLCAIDGEPRVWTESELAVLADLAESCTTEIRLRAEGERAARAEARASRRDEHSRVLLRFSERFAAGRTVVDVLDAVHEVAESVAGAVRCAVALVDGEQVRWARAEPVPGMPDDMWSPRALTEVEWPGVRAVAHRETFLFEDADALADVFPVMRGIGGPGATAIVPVSTRTATLGAVVLRWAAPRTFDTDLVDLLAALAGYAAVALERATLIEGQQRIATVLQGAMLGTLPAVADVALDAVYAPALETDRVGGDWFDVLPHPDGSLDLVVGDVTGHDLHAATLMGQLRIMLRTLAWENPGSASDVLARLDAVALGTRLDATGTVVLVRLGPAGSDGARDVRWSSAGHLPPVVVRADGVTDRASSDAPDLPLGLPHALPRTERALRLAPGDTLVLYTDGLVERRGTSLRASVDELLRVAAVHGAGLRAVDLLEALAPGGTADDDVAVLTATVGAPA
ncbi:serine phosphatase RsbU (regulator of sigma subunit) [Sediminihabitans luteus]|uniref:Serine phosphatase RsbU (Regulator of sigma subunit) n=1 Tax=Sediminihabitans luteus TaxID=1138585 RepID=A0A2M9D1B5_9CELL|nr:GAF domain-containing SpoIIE family protein phosphatase [Sediminihabitans luteus]PJJ77875.1 serine phosphatase RsbU (regulator of sigma subunit) [Sediminihabitans luteus]GII99767.1 hypothetical protein Slu03_21450 [Sediminihabitans luteus]